MSFINTILKSFSLVLFSDKREIGLVFLIAVFVGNPLQASMGLLSVILNYLIFSILSNNKKLVRDGFLTFNALLIGLALGHYLGFNWLSFLLLLFSIPLNVLLTLALQTHLTNSLGLPYLALPFVLVTWVILGISNSLNFKINGMETVFNSQSLPIPYAIKLFFINLGSVFFMPNPIVGLIAALGLILSSVMGTLLAVLGFYIGTALFIVVGGNPLILQHKILGFNYFLTMMALGGYFLVPTFRAFELGLIGVMLAVGIGEALPIFTFGLPPLAGPFVFVTLLILYVLKWAQIKGIQGIYPVPLDKVDIPERNLRSHILLEMTRKIPHRTRFTLPFFGKWMVTQGIDGRFTHQGAYRFAYDFESVDDNGRTFRNYGLNLADYFSYGLPIRAPAPAKVIRTRNDVVDNKPPSINPHDNWGNFVLLEHNKGEYTKIAHLMRGGIKVIPGDTLERGAVIGFCGNSGRSPKPHIHIQLQYEPVIGGATRELLFSSYVRKEGNIETLINHGVPKEGEILRTLQDVPEIQKFFPFVNGSRWVYETRGFNYKKTVWEVKQSQGIIWIEENGLRIYIERDPGAIRLSPETYPYRPTPLFLFFLGLELIPLEFNPNLISKLESPPEILLGRFSNALNWASFVFNPDGLYRLETTTRYTKLLQAKLYGETDIRVIRSIPRKIKTIKKEFTFVQGIGLQEMRVLCDDRCLYELILSEWEIGK